MGEGHGTVRMGGRKEKDQEIRDLQLISKSGFRRCTSGRKRLTGASM